MNIVTGYVGQPHITANEAQALNQGIFGNGNYVLNVGSKFAATLVSATSVSIQDGEGVIQGVQFRIAPGDVETVTISPGTTGYKRIDYICARYTKSAITGIEDVSLVVAEGTPDASTPTAPTINTGDVLTGSSPVDFPLWEVELDGLTPTLKMKYTLDATQMSEVYRLPYTEVSNSKISYNNTRLYIKPATKMLYFEVCFKLDASNTETEITIAEDMPLAQGYHAMITHGVFFPVSVVNASGDGFPSFGTIRGTAMCNLKHYSRTTAYDHYSVANIYFGSAPGANVFVLGGITVPYRRLNMYHPITEAEIVNDDM